MGFSSIAHIKRFAFFIHSLSCSRFFSTILRLSFVWVCVCVAIAIFISPFNSVETICLVPFFAFRWYRSAARIIAFHLDATRFTIENIEMKRTEMCGPFLICRSRSLCIANSSRVSAINSYSLYFRLLLAEYFWCDPAQVASKNWSRIVRIIFNDRKKRVGLRH